MSHGCYNRPAYVSIVPMQDGWYQDGYTRTPRMIGVPFRMAPDCQYTLTELGRVDVGCVGCKWRPG